MFYEGNVIIINFDFELPTKHMKLLQQATQENEKTIRWMRGWDSNYIPLTW